MKESGYGYVQEGYCEEGARTLSRVIDWRICSNKARYCVTFNGRSSNVCGTHLRQFYKTDWDNKPIKGKFLDRVEKVVDLKTGKTIYEKTYSKEG